MLSIKGTPWSPDGERAGDVNIRVDLPDAGGDRGAHPPDTIPLKTNSNDFGCFWNQLADSNSNFVVAKILYFFERFEFLVCSKFNHTHHVAVHVPVLWPVCTHTIPFRMLWLP